MKFVRIAAAAENFVLQVYRKKGRLYAPPFSCFSVRHLHSRAPACPRSPFPLCICLFVLPPLSFPMPPKRPSDSPSYSKMLTIVFCLFFYNLHGDEDALYHCHNPFHTLAARSGHDERLGWFCAFVTDRSGCRAAVRHSVREALVIANSVLTGK